MDTHKQPEIAGSHAPEVVPMSGLERRHSDNFPELVHGTDHEERAYYGPCEVTSDIPPKYEHHPEEEAQARRRKKRRRICIWVGMAILAVLIVVGAVLGGVLGSQASKKSSSSGSSSQNSSDGTSNTLQNTGLAVIVTDTGAQFAYQQLNGGSVIEIPQSSKGGWQFNSATTLAINAGTGSPLAATTYTYKGDIYRALTFVSADGQVMITNATGSGKWSTPINVLTGDTADTASPALALCADTQTLMGMRLYYGSQSGHVREVSYNFSKPAWTMSHNFGVAVTTAGFACSISGTSNHVYYRHVNSTDVKQEIYNFGDSSLGWHASAGSPSDHPAWSNTDIAVTADGSGTDYVFYRLGNGTVVRATVYGTDKTFHSYQNYTYVPQGSKFSSNFVGSGSSGSSLLLLQNPSGGVSSLLTDSSGSTTTSVVS